jgi:dTDP-4-amino-4,6-dideoxygalactose transaminase
MTSVCAPDSAALKKVDIVHTLADSAMLESTAPAAPAIVYPRRKRIPFTRPCLGDEEREAVLRVLESGQLGGNGPIGRQLDTLMQERFRVRRALSTTSCSHAMEMAAMVLNLRPGDEVIMPSFGFVTSATSVVRQGARPVFAEVKEDTFNLDVDDAARRITPRTRAILCVHYAGHACDMAALMRLADQHGLSVIEDAAQAVGARFNGRYLGAIGHMGCFSFHVSKNVICGEGGAFLTNDPAIAERAEIIREKGTDRSKFLRGEVDKYTWVDDGSSFVLSDLLAAVTLAQLSKLEDMQERRRHIWQRYQEGLADLAAQGRIMLPVIDERAQPNWHLYAFRVSDPAERDRVLTDLNQRGVDATFHFVPLHSSPYSRARWGYRSEDLPITERICASLIRLPIYPDLSREDEDYIIDALHEVLSC